MEKPTLVPNVACPSCRKLSPIDYIQKDTIYTWWCSEEGCGKQYRFVWRSADNMIDSEPTGTVHTKVSVLLRLPPQKEDIFLIIDGIRNEADKMKETKEHHKYYYEEHTCPSNLLHNGREVFLGKEADPHGIFEYIDTIKKIGKNQCGDDLTLEDFEKEK